MANNTPETLLHGEATLRPIAGIPEGATPLPHNGDLIIAASETVGHHHRIYCKPEEAMLYEKEGVVYLKVNSPVNLECRGKHDTEVLTNPAYVIGAQREYDYFADRERRVSD